MQLVHGTRLIVDANAPQQSPYVICFQNGCMSDYEATPELIANMKKGQNLVVQAINSNGAPLTLPLPLAGEFTKALTARRPIRRCSRKTRRSCRKNCRSAPKSSGRSSRPPGLRAPIRLRSKRPRHSTNKRAPDGAPFSLPEDDCSLRKDVASSAMDCAGGSRRTCPSRKSRPPANAGSVRRNRRAEDSVRRRRRRIRSSEFSASR